MKKNPKQQKADKPKDESYIPVLKDIVDIDTLQAILEDLYKVIGIGCAIIDLKGEALVLIGWQDICLNFHIVNPLSYQYCMESDIVLSSDIPLGEYKLYRCKNNMLDMVTPIIVNGIHVGKLFVGQFFFDDETVDQEIFRAQALKYGYVLDDYLAALEKVPRISRSFMGHLISFYSKLATMISDLGHNNSLLKDSIIKHAELINSLQSSELKFKNYLDESPVGISVSEESGTFLYANPVIVSITGYNPEELKTKSIFDLVIQEEHPNLIKHLESLHTDATPIEVTIKTKSAELRNLLVHPSMLEDKSILAYIIDITDKKKAEADLKLQAWVIDQISDRVTITDLDGNIKNVNKAEAEALGYSESDMKTMSVYDYGENPAKGATQEEIIRLTKEQGTWKGEVINYTKDGKEIILEVRTNLIVDNEGNPIAMCGISTDITEKQRNEAILQYQRDLEHFVLDFSHELVETKCEDFDSVIEKGLGRFGKFMEVDRIYVFRYDLEKQLAFNTHEWCNEGIEPQISILQGVSLALSPHWMLEMNRGNNVVIPSVADMPDQWKQEKEFLLQLGIQSLLAIPIEYKKELLGFIGIDCTQEPRKWDQVDAVILRMVGDLIAGAIKRLKFEQELIISKEKAEESNRIKSAFLATMNHELRTPLNHILGFAQLLEFDPNPQELKYYTQQITKSGNDLLLMIQDIFDLALAEQSQIVPRPHKFDSMAHFLENRQILQECLIASGKQNAVKLKFSPDISILQAIITADMTKINQVLNNLFKNAIKFTHSGTIEFGFECISKDLVRYYVKDTGIGIPAGKQDMIFDYFCQADDSNTRMYGGVGIGLAISKRMTEIMGGTLKLESTEGSGSTFTLEVPVEIDFREIRESDAATSDVGIPNLTGKKILIVDDDKSSRYILKSYLKSTGAIMAEAENGEIAIGLLASDPTFDLVLMDIQMPVVDGYSATQQIRELFPNVLVIAVTAYILDQKDALLSNVSFDAVISKPVKRDVFYRELSKVLKT